MLICYTLIRAKPGLKMYICDVIIVFSECEILMSQNIIRHHYIIIHIFHSHINIFSHKLMYILIYFILFIFTGLVSIGFRVYLVYYTLNGICNY